MLSAGWSWLGDRSRPPTRPARELGYLVVGTMPAVVAGVLFRHAIEGSFRSLWVIASAMIGVALLLAVVEKKAAHVRTFDELTLRDALIIGCAQAFAVIPGVSRSGSTLMAAHGARLPARGGGALLVPAQRADRRGARASSRCPR